MKNHVTAKQFLGGAFAVFSLIGGVMKANADPAWAMIIDTDMEGRYYQYFIDRTGDGIEDGVVQVHPRSSVASLFRRYLQVGGRVLYENDNSDDFNINEVQLLRIEMPDGRIIRVADFAGQYSNFHRAREYEAQQAAQEAVR